MDNIKNRLADYSKATGLNTMQGINSRVKGLLKQPAKIPKAGLSAGIGAIANPIGSLIGNAIADGYEGAGSTVGEIGGQLGSAIGMINPVAGAIVSVGSKVLGGVGNRAFGIKTNYEKLNAANNSINYFNNFTSNAGSFDELKGPESMKAFSNPYKGGWFRSAAGKNEELKNRYNDGKLFAERSVLNNAGNIMSDQINNAIYKVSAFGGPLNSFDGMGAVEYDLLSDYLNGKNKQVQSKTPMTNVFMNTPKGLFALGGDIQMHGGDYSTGATHINAGGSHEENKYDGVQMGVDQQGVPNLVEEGEVVWNEYVFSNRIELDEESKKKLHFPKKKDISYADAARKLEKEISERPNDPISQAGFKAQMETLAEQQERQKTEMEAQRAKEAFEALSPEEQTAVMQQVAAQEQAAMQQQAMAEQQMQGVPVEQPAPEELMQQSTVQADGSPAALGQEAPMIAAEGGVINKFEEGGSKKHPGKFKNAKGMWDKYTRKGLETYLGDLEARMAMAPDDATKQAIRQEAIDTFAKIQKGYADIYPSEESETYSFNPAVQAHQVAFNDARGNTGFYSTDANGNVTNLIAQDIDIPNGGNVEDIPTSWADGYWGPRTSIRNFGSTEYGNTDYYKDLADRFAKIGLIYAPNEEWKYGNNTLYGLSMENAAEEVSPNSARQMWNYETKSPAIETTATTPATIAPITEKPVGSTDTSGDLEPVHRSELPRYMGLMGPAVGLGMMAAGVGKPDMSEMDRIVANSARTYHTAANKYLGNYMKYQPLDIWFQQAKLDAQSRAADRSVLNSGANQGSKMAGILANGLNSQIASGNLFRQAQEYNDAMRKQVADFNRGTDQFNAEAFNRLSQFNASEANRADQFNSHLAMQAAREKEAARAGWYNSLYGNVNQMFKGMSDLGTENTRNNMVNWALAKGLFGTVNPDDEFLKGRVRRKQS